MRVLNGVLATLELWAAPALGRAAAARAGNPGEPPPSRPAGDHLGTARRALSEAAYAQA